MSIRPAIRIDFAAVFATGGQKLSGPFPEELAHLPFLRDLSLAVNDLTGPIPKSLAHEMRHLQDIQINSNLLSGTIPSELFTFENLQRVNLGANRCVKHSQNHFAPVGES